MIAGVGVEDLLPGAVGDLGGEPAVLVDRGRRRGCRAASHGGWSSSPKPGAMCTTPVPSSVVDEVAGEDHGTRSASSAKKGNSGV